MEQVFEDSACRTLELVRGLKCFSDTSPTVWIDRDCFPPYGEVVTRNPLFGSSELNVFVDCIEGQANLTFGLIFPYEWRLHLPGKQNGEHRRLSGKLWAWNSKSKQIFNKPFDSRTNYGSSSQITHLYDNDIVSGSILCVYRNLQTNRIHFVINGKEGMVSFNISAPAFCYGYVRLCSRGSDSKIQVTLRPQPVHRACFIPSPPLNKSTQVVKRLKPVTPNQCGLVTAIRQELEQQFSHETQRLQGKCTQLEQENIELQDRPKEFKEAMNPPGAYRKTEEKSKEAVEAQQRTREPEQRNTGLEKKVQKQGNNLNNSTDKLAASQQKVQELQQQIHEQRNNHEGSQRKLKQLEQRNIKLEEKLQEQENELERSQRKLKQHEQRNIKLEEKLQEQENEHERSQRKLKQLEQRNIKLEEKLQEQENELEHAAELDRYEIGEGPRGICLVINNVHFFGEGERHGGEIDEKKIVILFSEELHFIVEIKRNLSGVDILKSAQEIAAKDHSKYAAFVFIIMSHGDKKDAIQGVDGRKARVEDLMSEFTATNCPTLESKPKLFFIQACRGQASDRRMSRLAPADNIEGDSFAVKLSADSNLPNGISPREADFLLAFATVPGYKAWRSKKVGSWFIQVLVDVIRKHHRHHHLLDMLTEVNKQVADIANEYPDKDLSFQVPAPTHTLRAQVFL